MSSRGNTTRRVRITIRITRYEREKILGTRYRLEAKPRESFTEFRKRVRESDPPTPRRRNNK